MSLYASFLSDKKEAPKQQRKVSSFAALSRLSCIALLLLISSPVVNAGCLDDKCCYDRECGTNGYCNGGKDNVLGCACDRSCANLLFTKICTGPKENGYCIREPDLQNDGESALNGHAASCKSKKEHCSTCADSSHKVPDTRKCKKNSHCKSDWCEGGDILSCDNGRCKSKRSDGSAAYKHDNNSCKSGNEVCGICGAKQNDDNKCTKNSHCKSDWCEGGDIFSCDNGRCKSKRSDGSAAYNGDYSSCKSGNGICGICGTKQNNGNTCSENSDCKSGWCNGLITTGCAAKCRDKVNDGSAALLGDYNSCKSGNGICGICGIKQNNGNTCSVDSDCKSGWCNGEYGLISCIYKCGDKIDDNQQCPLRGTTNVGFDNACKSGKCMELLWINPAKTKAYCRPKGGFSVGVPCTQDSDCFNTLWCDGGSATNFGKCAPCPANCGTNGCHSCNNQKSRMVCGRTKTIDTLVCAGEVAATKTMEFFECFVGEDLKCVTNLADETIKCANDFNNCVFTVDDCLSFEFDETMEGYILQEKPFMYNGQQLNNWVHAKIVGNTKGKANVILKVKPKDLTVDLEFQVDSEVSVYADIQASVFAGLSQNVKVNQKKKLGERKRIFRKVFMAGKVPILVEAHVEPWAYADLQFNHGNKLFRYFLSNDYSFSQKAFIDLKKGEVKLNEPTITSKNDRMNFWMTNQFSAVGTLRAGPKISVSVYKVPVEFDIVARTGASMRMWYNAQLTNGKKEWCIDGYVGINLGTDFRVGTLLPMGDPVQFAKDTCKEATGVVTDVLDVANGIIDRAQCFTDFLDIDTSDIDEVQADSETIMSEFANNICEESINALVPEELQKASCTIAKAVSSASEWMEMASIAVGFDSPFSTEAIGFCRTSKLVKRVEVKHALQDLGC